jgi:hypothetical protein
LQLLETISPDAEDKAEEAEGHSCEHEERDHPQWMRDLERYEQARRAQDDQAQDDRLGRGCSDVTDDDLDRGNGSRQELVYRTHELGKENGERCIGDALRQQREHDESGYDKGTIANPIDSGDARTDRRAEDDKIQGRRDNG